MSIQYFSSDIRLFSLDFGHKMSSNYFAYLNLNSVSEELYNSIIDGNFSYAVKLSSSLADKHSFIITDVVSKLTEAIDSKLLSFAYMLWASGEKAIVKQYFPKSYSLIFNEDDVVFTNNKYNQAVKLAYAVDSDGDRVPWGDPNDKTSSRVSWKVIPIWENNKVHFILKNLSCNQFLKMGLFPDDINDRPVYGASSHQEVRHTWYLDPILYHDSYLFLIRNRQFNQRLKLAVSADNIGDRRLWGHNGEIEADDVGRFAWAVTKHPDSHSDEL